MRRSPIWVPALLVAAVMLGPPRLEAQAVWSTESFDEIDALSVRADISGGLRDADQVARLLEAAIAAELRRAEIRFPVVEGRQEVCCLLRLDVRMVSTAARFRGAVGYTVRLELGQVDRTFPYPVWVTIWASRTLDGFFDPPDLVDALRHSAQDLAEEFVDRFRERFPIDR